MRTGSTRRLAMLIPLIVLAACDAAPAATPTHSAAIATALAVATAVASGGAGAVTSPPPPTAAAATPPPQATPRPAAVATAAPTRPATATPAPSPAAARALGAKIGARALNLSATFDSIGVELLYDGDDDRNGTAALSFKKASEGDGAWRDGLPLWQTVGAGPPGRAFYGSALFLEPGTAYDVRVTLADPGGVDGSAVTSARATTRAEDIAPASALAPTRFVSAAGDDKADGASEASAWRTLEQAVRAAPAGAVVRVGPGYYAAPATPRKDPLALVAEHPAVDDARNPANAGRHSVVESGPVAGPAGASEPGVVRAPWEPVSLAGTGKAGAPAGASYKVWRWSKVPIAAPGWLGYGRSRDAVPTRLAQWAPKGDDMQSPAGWAEKLYANRTYNHGWVAFPNGAGFWDLYARLPGDLDPNSLYLSVGGASGFMVAGPDVRVSGFELRPASSGVLLGTAATGTVIDHNLIAVGFVGVRFDGDKEASPPRYGSDHLVERNLIVDSSLWTADHAGAPAIPWGFIKGGIYNPDGTIYGSDRLGEAAETSGVWSRGGARRVVVRHNTIDGTFNGVGAYNVGFDRYATQDQDVHDNLLKHVSDDAFEPEQVAINWRIWNNRVEQSSVFLSTGPVAYGPLYVVRNEAWRVGKDGVGRDVAGNPAVGTTFFKYSGSSDPQARLYVLHNTLWTDSTFAGPNDTQKGVDGSGQYAGGGAKAEFFYMRNNVVRATRYAFQAGPWDEDANSFSTSDPERGLAALGKRFSGDVAAFRAAVGRPTRTNVGWVPGGPGSFVRAVDVDAWLSRPTEGDLRLAAGSPFVDGGVPVPNVSDHRRTGPGDVTGYAGTAPDLGATEQ
ncbi:MAG TPA: hypothetical protein VGM69_10635 [Chloroflexota bacterium]|jgi:hypothetical protein